MKYIVNPSYIELTRAEVQQAIEEFLSRNQLELGIPGVGLRCDPSNLWRGQPTALVEFLFDKTEGSVVGCRLFVEIERKDLTLTQRVRLAQEQGEKHDNQD